LNSKKSVGKEFFFKMFQTDPQSKKKSSVPWKKIWRLSCPPKIKQFVWRLANNSLALKMNIKRRNIELDTVCPVCRCFDEDGAHCFLKCKLARHCWNAAQLGGVCCLLLNSHSSEEFIRMILELQTDQCLWSVILLWKLWDARNKANAGESIPTCTEVVCAAYSVFRDFAGEVVQPNRANVQIYSQKPPVLDYLKINFDGAFRRETQEAACGFIIRNHLGESVPAGAACGFIIRKPGDGCSGRGNDCMFICPGSRRETWNFQG
jgi:hypothetical protein